MLEDGRPGGKLESIRGRDINAQEGIIIEVPIEL